MNKDISINIRIDEDNQRMLDELCQETVRTKSDMVRYLIRQEWDRRQTTDKPVYSATGDKPAIIIKPYTGNRFPTTAE